MDKQRLASKIWESANNMRSKIEAHEYKDYILGFIFYKFLSEQEERKLREVDWTEENIKELNDDYEHKDFITKNLALGYFISYPNLFSTWIKNPDEFDIRRAREALSAFSRNIDDEINKKVFENIFTTLENGITKLGDGAIEQTKAVRRLITLIDGIPMDAKQNFDVLGFIYEYLISNFAANAGKKAGEFYTPHEVSLLMSELIAHHLEDRPSIEIYDPTSGSGSLLINIGKCVARRMKDPDSITYYAQELKEATYNLTRMNLIMRDIKPSNIVTRRGDTLAQDWPLFDENHQYSPLYVDAVVSNPPYSQSWDADSREKLADPRFASYGYAPRSKADYAFLLHSLYHLKDHGIMAIVLPHGVLFRGNEEARIRTNLIENNNIDTIIGLPANIFYGTGIPTIIMILKKHRQNSDVFIIDASKYFLKDGKSNRLRQSDIRRIVDAYVQRTDIPKFAKKVSREEIRANDYNLNIPRYVDSSEEPEPIDIYASMFGGIPVSEIDRLDAYFKVFPSLRNELFAFAVDRPYATLLTEDIKATTKANRDVQGFINDYQAAFQDFAAWLDALLLADPTQVTINTLETTIADEIVRRIKPFSLVDQYVLYQKLDDIHQIIAQDLETIHLEGFECIGQVDPHMVEKKKDGRTTEVQEGWEGHIIPFELIERLHFTEELNKINDILDQLNELQSQRKDIFNELDDETKEMIINEQTIVNKNGDDFAPKGVTVHLDALAGKSCSDEEIILKEKLCLVNDLFKKERKLVMENKQLTAALKEKDRRKIETLNHEECLAALKAKWIDPILAFIKAEPEAIIAEFISRADRLSHKYASTLIDINKELKETERSLAAMIDDLTGNECDMAGLAELKNLLTEKTK